jgi:hypothetical protein
MTYFFLALLGSDVGDIISATVIDGGSCILSSASLDDTEGGSSLIALPLSSKLSKFTTLKY